jgi:hypothetical protein
VRHSIVRVQNELALLTNKMSIRKSWDMRLHRTDVRVSVQDLRSIR